MLLAEEEEGMRSMIGRLKEYLEKKKLELNVGKTKIMKILRNPLFLFKYGHKIR